jgi:hypothetical protein
MEPAAIITGKKERFSPSTTKRLAVVAGAGNRENCRMGRDLFQRD